MSSQKKIIYSWAFYDWANSAFGTTVMAGFFPVFFKKYYALHLEPSESTMYLGVCSSLVTFLIVLSAPMLGVFSDLFPVKKKLVFLFTLLGALSTSFLALVDQGSAVMACLVYGMAMFFHASSTAPYDALLPSVAPGSQKDRVSSLGYALGYIGGGILFALNILMFMKPESFFLSSGVQSIKVSFVTVTLWWIVFSIPLFKNVPEYVSPHAIKNVTSFKARWKLSAAQLIKSLGELRKHKNILLFLLAFFLYNDALGTVVKMSVDYGLSIGFPDNSLMVALLIVQFVGFPATLILGSVAERYHPKHGILIGIGIYFAVLCWAVLMSRRWELYAIAVLIGCAQGGVQALSRSFYARLIPREKAGEFFGFYNLLGKFSGFLGPLLVAGSAFLSGNSRLSFFVINFLFFPGAFLLLRVKEGKTVKA